MHAVAETLRLAKYLHKVRLGIPLRGISKDEVSELKTALNESSVSDLEHTGETFMFKLYQPPKSRGPKGKTAQVKTVQRTSQLLKTASSGKFTKSDLLELLEGTYFRQPEGGEKEPLSKQRTI